MKSNFFMFWGGPLSQWHPSNFIDDNGVMYNCCEQYMMAKKAELFGDIDTYEKIMKESDPKLQKKLGREVKNFNADIWEKNALDIVFQGNVYKFSQNEKLKQGLAKTKGQELVEASPYDKIWGIGLAERNPDAWDKSKWKGLNLLGKTLDKVREEICD